MLKRVLSEILCAVILAGTVSGCASKTGKTSSSSQSSSSQATATEAFKLPLTAKPTSVTWATPDSYYAPASLNSGLAIWPEIEKKTNVKVNWQVVPNDQYNTSMQVKFSAASNLADIVAVPNGDPSLYGQSGLLIPIDDLIQKYAPNIQKVFEENPGVKAAHTSPDGHIYGLTPIMADLPEPWLVRKDWLDKLNLKEPDTLDDWVAMLQAFKDKDPNGNGKKDEIAFCASPSWFGEAFGLPIASPATSEFEVVDGKVSYAWTDPKMVDLLTFVNKLYTKGLLDPDYGNQSAEGIESKVANNRVSSYVMYFDWGMDWEKELQKAGVADARYIPVMPPKGPNGHREIIDSGLVDGGFTSISKDCKDPVTAIKLMDYLWSPEGQRYLAWGIEGKTYTMENGKPKFTEFVTNNKDGLGVSDALRTVGAWPTIPWVQQKDQYQQMLDMNDDYKNFASMIKPITIHPFPIILPSKEETDRLTVLENDITTYRSEMYVKFVTGKEPISNFSKFVETLKGMGLDEFVQIKQKQYDRYVSVK